MIRERAVRPHVALETFQASTNPFVLGSGRLGATKLRPAGTEIVWTDWADKLLNVNMRRGGKVTDAAHRNEVGTLEVTLRDVALDVYNPEFVAGQKIRLVLINGTQRHDLFTGEIREFDTKQLRMGAGKRPVDVVQLSAVDKVKDHNDTTRYGAMPDGGVDTFAERIARLQRTAPGVLAIPTQPIPGQLGRTVYESSLSNHLDIACNTVGAWWYVGGDGVTRFQRRRMPNPAPASLVTFVERSEEFPGTPWPAGVLHMRDWTTARGSRVMFTGLDYANHGAQDDPDNPGTWIADDPTWRGVRLADPISRFGLHVATIETNYPEYPGPNDENHLLSAYTLDSILIETLTWNAQEDLTRIPDLDLGGYVELPLIGNSATAPWRWYIVGGIRHTITPTRWLIELSLIGVPNHGI